MAYRNIDSVSRRIKQASPNALSNAKSSKKKNNIKSHIPKLRIRKSHLQKLSSAYLMLLMVFQSIAGVFVWVPKGNEAKAAYMTLTSNPVPSIVGPYDTAAPASGGGWGAAQTTESINSREFITLGQQYRIRQSGTISRIKLYAASKINMTAFYVKIWRKNGSNYDLVGTSNNIIDSITAGDYSTIDLISPILGVQEGDYYGYRIETNGSGTGYAFHARTSISNVTTYLVDDTIPASTDYEWTSQIAYSGIVLPIELYMQSPQSVFIGDSIIVGHPLHCNFLTCGTSTTNIASTIESQFGTLTGYTYQNMGIGAQTTTQIAARFINDVVNLHPRIAVIEGGVNDIANASVTKAAFLNNWNIMLNACQANNIIPVVIPIMPWTNGTADQMNTRDDWNTSLVVLAETYSNAIIADMSSAVGQYSADGPEGNLWDIKTAYNQDGVHFNAAGHGVIAAVLANALEVPVVSEVTPIAALVANAAPSYTFNTTKAGNITYSGDCSSSTASAVAGNNTITFNTLSDGTHSNCKITIIAPGGNQSNALSIAPFTTDATPPSAFTPSFPADNSYISDSAPTFSWNSSTDSESGLSKYQLYIDGIMDRDNISSSVTSAVSSSTLPCGNHSWYVKSIDNAGNSTNSNISNFTVNCSISFTSPIKPQTSNISITSSTTGTINIDNIPQTITQIAISTNKDFTNSSWEDISKKEELLKQYSNQEEIYIKLRTNDGAVSDTITYNSQQTTDSNSQNNTDTGNNTINDGDIVKTPSSPDIYVIKTINNKKYKRLILSPNVFNSYHHLKWENIKTITEEQLSQYQTSNLVKELNDTIIYLLTPQGDRGQRKPFDITQTYDIDSVYTINKTDRDSYEWEE